MPTKAKGYRYPGVNFFKREDANLFYGREEDIDKLYTQVILGKTLVIHADSGSGKSSIVQAGLLPKLEVEQPDYVPVVIRLDYYKKTSLKKGVAAIETLPLLHETIARIKDHADFAKVSTPPNLDGVKDSLWLIAKKINWDPIVPGKRKLLLIFDQFEELQTFSADNVLQFKKGLAELLNNQMASEAYAAIRQYKDKVLEKPDLSEDERSEFNRNIQFVEGPLEAKAVFVVREDKLGTMSLLADYFPDILKNDFVLKALSQENALRSLKIPAELEGDFLSLPFTFEPGAAEALLSQIADIVEDGKRMVDPLQAQIAFSTIERTTVMVDKKTHLRTPDLPNVSDIITRFYNDSWAGVKKELGSKIKDFDLKRWSFNINLVTNGSRNLVHEDLLVRSWSQAVDLRIIAILMEKGLIRDVPGGKKKFYQLCHDRFIAPLSDDLKKISERIVMKEKVKKTLTILGIVIGVVLVIAIVVSAYLARTGRLTQDVQQELLGNLKTIRRSNPTLAYVYMRAVQMEKDYSDSTDFTKYLHRLDSVKDGYLLCSFPVNGPLVQAAMSQNNQKVVLMDKTSVTTWSSALDVITNQAKIRSGSYVKTVWINGQPYTVVTRNSSIEIQDLRGGCYAVLSNVTIPKNIDVSPDGKYILLADTLYNLVTKRKAGVIRPGPGIENNLVVSTFLSNGRRIAAGYLNGCKVIYEIEDQQKDRAVVKKIAVLPPDGEGSKLLGITSLVSDSKDRFLIAGNKSNTVEVWQIGDFSVFSRQPGRRRTRNPYLTELKGHTSEVSCVTLSPNDSMVLSGSNDHTAIVWDLYSGEKLSILKGMDEDVVFTRFFAHSNQMVTVTKNDIAYIWSYGRPKDLYTGNPLANYTPFDYYNVESTDKGYLFSEVYDTSGILHLFGYTLHYISHMPAANNYPQDADYNANMAYSLDEIDKMYRSLTANPAFSTDISLPNKAILYKRYFSLLSRRPYLLNNTQGETDFDVAANSAQLSSVQTSLLLLDTTDLVGAIDVAESANLTAYSLMFMGTQFSTYEYTQIVSRLRMTLLLLDAFDVKNHGDPMIRSGRNTTLSTLALVHLSHRQFDSTLSLVQKIRATETFYGQSEIIPIQVALAQNDYPRAVNACKQMIAGAKNGRSDYVTSLTGLVPSLRDLGFNNDAMEKFKTYQNSINVPSRR